MTVPEPFGAEFAYAIRCRTTIGALIEILASARSRVILGAPFMQRGRGLSDARLVAALRGCLERGVEVNIVSTSSGLASLDRQAIEEGGNGRLRLFTPAANVANSRVLGSHAKFCVSDASSAYIGSANFTGPGIDSQLEVGVLTQGVTASQLAGFWNYCLARGIFVQAGI